jgi:hypothetical protein
MSIDLILAIIALVLAVVDVFRPMPYLLNVATALLALTFLV